VILCFVHHPIRRTYQIAVVVGQPEQVHFADGRYVKLFLHGQIGDGRFELIHDDHPHGRIFRLSDQAPAA